MSKPTNNNTAIAVAVAAVATVTVGRFVYKRIKNRKVKNA